MQFTTDNIFHVYNRGNNSQQIFFEERNYVFFLEKVKIHIGKYSDILAYCLMPNHFHLMIYIKPIANPDLLNNEIGILLRSYTRAVNKQENRTGSLFQQKTRAKNVGDYPHICLNYIHQNPFKAGIADNLELWKYSSFSEYFNSKALLCNIQLGMKIAGYKSPEEFRIASYNNLDKDLIEKIL